MIQIYVFLLKNIFKNIKPTTNCGGSIFYQKATSVKKNNNIAIKPTIAKDKIIFNATEIENLQILNNNGIATIAPNNKHTIIPQTKTLPPTKAKTATKIGVKISAGINKIKLIIKLKNFFIKTTSLELFCFYKLVSF